MRARSNRCGMSLLCVSCLFLGWIQDASACTKRSRRARRTAAGHPDAERYALAVTDTLGRADV